MDRDRYRGAAVSLAALRLSRLRLGPGDLLLARSRDPRGVSPDAVAALTQAAERRGASVLVLAGEEMDFRAIPASVVADLPGVADEAEWGELLRRIEGEVPEEGEP